VGAAGSTLDLGTRDGDAIPIEERHAREVTHVGSNQLAPEGAQVRNPSFDVTPHKYITAIITERGVFKPPFVETLRQSAIGNQQSATSNRQSAIGNRQSGNASSGD
jgi:methylthioribose-1-phosphate isomerase